MAATQDIKMSRQKSKLSDHPPVVKQLAPIAPKVVVQHRSDMLMEEQINNVKNMQCSLERALSNLENARSHQQAVHCRSNVEELVQRLDSMMLVLKIVHKINNELVYARADLQTALKEGLDINRARKRIGWLEDRIDNLLGKRRKRMSKDQEDNTRGDCDVGVQLGSISSLGSFDAPEPSFGSSPAGSVVEREHLPGGQNLSPRIHDQQSNPEDDGLHKIPDESEMSESHSQHDDLNNNRGSEGVSIALPHSSTSQTPTISERPSSASLSIPNPEATPPAATDKDTPGRIVTSTSVSSRSSSPESTLKDDNSVTPVPALLHSQGKLQENRSLKSKSSRVTVMSPSELGSNAAVKDDEDAMETDAGRAYWQSEHHRFDYSDYAPMLIELDPLSYHQMGLAVPGTFVENVTTAAELPWRSDKCESDVTDIHERALEGLSAQMNKLYQKVREASLLSVHASDNKEFKRPTFMHEYDASSRATSSKQASEPTLAKHGINRPDSKESIAFPALNKERLGSSLSNRLVYYPNPLPYPEKLPITMTNHGKEIPQTSGVFSQSVPGKDPPALRIVDQRNLLNETKFTSSLFRSKASSKKPIAGNEKKFRKMLKDERVPAGKEGSQPEKRSLMSAFHAASAMVKFQVTGAKWNEMKPLSGVLEHSGLKWERVKSIVHNNLISSNVEERIDAARHLGVLKSGDSMVLYALRERLRHDENSRVVYEATKSLVSLGCWDEEVMSQIVSYLLDGNRNMKYDILKTMIHSKNIHFVDKKTPVFRDLSRALSLLCMNMDPKDDISFYAALTLGQLCVVDKNAKAKLQSMYEVSENTHQKSQALDILVRQMNLHDWGIVCGVLHQLQRSPVWKYRKEAARQLVHIGSRHILLPEHTENVFEILERRLWDDPKKEVRLEVAKVLAAFDLFAKACEKVEKKLEDASEDVRAQAVISVGTLGMKNERIIRALLEMTDLDGSEYVRLMVLRTFGVLRCQDKRVYRVLKAKESGEGAMAREARRALDMLSKAAESSPPTRTTQTRTTNSSST